MKQLYLPDECLFLEDEAFASLSNVDILSGIPQLKKDQKPGDCLVSKQKYGNRCLLREVAVVNDSGRAFVTTQKMASLWRQRQFDQQMLRASCDGLAAGQVSPNAILPRDEAHKALRKKRKSPTNKYQWERVRPEITRLYMEENYRLKDVMKLLESVHGFKASLRMYKNKLLEWGLHKRIRRKQIEPILVVDACSDPAVGSSELFLQDDIACPRSINASQANSTDNTTEMVEKKHYKTVCDSRGTICQTSPPSPSQLHLACSTTAMEKLFHATITYVDTALDSRNPVQCLWLSANEHSSAHPDQAVAEAYNIIDSGVYVARLMRNCIFCLDQGLLDEFWLILRKIFLDLEGVILSAHPMAWCRLIWVCNSLVMRGYSELAKHFWQHLQSLVAGISSNRPHKKVLQQLTAIDIANISFPLQLYQVAIRDAIEKHDTVQNEVLSIWKATTHNLEVDNPFIPHDDYIRVRDFLIQCSRQTYGGKSFALLVATSHLVMSEEGLDGGATMFQEGLNHLATATNDQDRFLMQTLLLRSRYIIKKACGHYDDVLQDLRDYKSNLEMKRFKYDMVMEGKSTQTILRLMDWQWINPSKDRR